MLQTRLSRDLAASWQERLDWWTHTHRTQRLWSRDSGLWSGADESSWLGWLEPSVEPAMRHGLRSLAAEFLDLGIQTVVLVGMGGSALGAEVLDKTARFQPAARRLVLLDTTDPRELDLAIERTRRESTRVISASKSGSTLETRLVTQLLLDHVPPECFIAITDDGSLLQELAREVGFSHIFEGNPSIGGRFSVLSPFGLVPAACLGSDIDRIVNDATRMAKACRRHSAEDNPGASLGCLLGASLEHGRDKLTIVCSEAQVGFANWLEQLIAESTGKGGSGMLPIVGEELASSTSYGNDRLFLHLVDGSGVASKAASARLSAAGQPIVRLPAASPQSLGGELYRWMFATSVLGACMGINPFDQPDVEASKQKTRGLIERLSSGESLELGRVSLSTDSFQMVAENLALPDHRLSLDDLLGALLAQPQVSDYLTILAYLPRDEEVRKAVSQLRSALLSKSSSIGEPITTALGWGPRYLHSNGQLFKGGPPTGRFLLLTADRDGGPKVPGNRFSFGDLQLAQALGDAQVLRSLGKPLLWARLRAAPVKAIEEMVRTVERLG